MVQYYLMNIYPGTRQIISALLALLFFASCLTGKAMELPDKSIFNVRDFGAQGMHAAAFAANVTGLTIGNSPALESSGK